MSMWHYSALHYLNQWLTLDHDLHHGMIQNNPEAVRLAICECAAHYGVARNLWKMFDVNAPVPVARMEPIVGPLQLINQPANDGDAIAAIDQYAGHVAKFYHKRLPVFASKVLWMRFRVPLIIYDSNVRVALDHRGHAIHTLAAYVASWRQEWAANFEYIARACNWLGAQPPLEQYAPLIALPWFQERVLDMFLWHEGDPRYHGHPSRPGLAAAYGVILP